MQRITNLKHLDRWLGQALTRMLPAAQAGRAPAGGRILVIRPGGIGDMVHLAPTLQRLKVLYPAGRIEVLAEGRNAGILPLCPGVDRTWRYDRAADLLAVLRSRYDLVIDTEQWHRLSAVVARLVRSDRKIGFATNERRRMFTDAVPYRQDDYEIESFLHLLEALAAGAGEWSAPFLAVPEPAAGRAAELLGPKGSPRVVLFPGASIPERQWGEARFAGLAERLHASGAKVVIVGGRQDRAQAEAIAARGRGLNLAGQTSLAETAAVIAAADLLVSGDSGLLHIAVGLDIPTVSLFGPGRVRKWGPPGRRHIVLNKELPCSPCTTFGYTPPCPIQARCLQEITVEEVFAAARKLLARGERHGPGAGGVGLSEPLRKGVS